MCVFDAARLMWKCWIGFPSVHQILWKFFSLSAFFDLVPPKASSSSRMPSIMSSRSAMKSDYFFREIHDWRLSKGGVVLVLMKWQLSPKFTSNTHLHQNRHLSRFSALSSGQEDLSGRERFPRNSFGLFDARKSTQIRVLCWHRGPEFNIGFANSLFSAQVASQSLTFRRFVRRPARLRSFRVLPPGEETSVQVVKILKSHKVRRLESLKNLVVLIVLRVIILFFGEQTTWDGNFCRAWLINSCPNCPTKSNACHSFAVPNCYLPSTFERTRELTASCFDISTGSAEEISESENAASAAMRL